MMESSKNKNKEKLEWFKKYINHYIYLYFVDKALIFINLSPLMGAISS